MMDEIKDEIKGEIRKGIREELQKDWEKEKRRNPHCDGDSWWEERRMGMKVFLGVLMGVGFLILGFLFGWVVMLLWNWLMPEIFGLGEVTYWQAWGLLILSSILFKRFPSNNGADGGKRGDRRRKKELRKMMDSESHIPERQDMPGKTPAPEA
ncbi:MAG: hypothetical protein JXR86_21260 [Spirochaetales bacterium]|nr:hypothetical protein [Spirochaetales bacterium]